MLNFLCTFLLETACVKTYTEKRSGAEEGVAVIGAFSFCEMLRTYSYEPDTRDFVP